MTTVERKYALTKIAAGDYLLPSNDAQTIWRISRYTDGPSHGIDWGHDENLWGVWRWPEQASVNGYVEDLDWENWEFCEGGHDSRADAIQAALRTETPDA